MDPIDFPPLVKHLLLNFIVEKTNRRKTMTVNVMTLTGKIIVLESHPEDFVEEFKSQIEVVEGIPPDQQRVIFAGKELTRDDTAMKDYGINHDSTLNLVLRLRGGARTKQTARKSVGGYRPEKKQCVEKKETRKSQNVPEKKEVMKKSQGFFDEHKGWYGLPWDWAVATRDRFHESPALLDVPWKKAMNA